MPVQLIYITPFLVAAVLISVVAALTWPRREARGGKLVVFLCLTCAFWCSLSVLLYLGNDLETNVFLTNLEYLAIAVLPPLLLVTVCTVFGHTRWLQPSRLVVLFCLSPLTLLAVWTNPLHHLYYLDYRLVTDPFPILSVVHGPLWYVHIVYQHLLALATTLILVRQVARSRQFWRGQALVILIAVLTVWVGNIIYVSGLSPFPHMDTTPIAITVVAGAFAWGLFRYNLLDLVPVAKAEVFNGLQDPILVLSTENRVVDLNAAAEALAGDRAARAIGAQLADAFADWPGLVLGVDERAAEVELVRHGRTQTFELQVSELADRRAKQLGQLVVLHDISLRKRMEEQLTRLAATDSLTGIANRRYLLEMAEAELESAQRYGRQLSVLMMDLDHFKRVNDTHGHDIGDQALITLVHACLPELRATDHFGRLGGEEFAAVLVETGLTDAARVAERLRSRVAATALRAENTRVGITVSIGVATLDTRDASVEDLLNRADAALYLAKAGGRDRVATEKELDAPSAGRQRGALRADMVAGR